PDHVCSDFGQCLASGAATDGGVSVNPTCPRNEALLDQISTTPRACGFDDECPFGAHCDRAKSACVAECRHDSDCASHGADSVCDCLGTCVEPSAPRQAPASELPTLELDRKVFLLSRPADITQPNWGDSNVRDVQVRLLSATADSDSSG